jgi:hypothetical protein
MIETKTDRYAAFWTEVRKCEACDERGWINTAGPAGNEYVSRCPNHDWKAHTPDHEPTYDELANINKLDPVPYPAEWTAEQRTRAYWRALRNNITIRSETTWVALLKQIEEETEARKAQQ